MIGKYPKFATREYWVTKIQELEKQVEALKNENLLLKEKLAETNIRFMDDGK